jgi:hypothetical protein
MTHKKRSHKRTAYHRKSEVDKTMGITLDVTKMVVATSAGLAVMGTAANILKKP